MKKLKDRKFKQLEGNYNSYKKGDKNLKKIVSTVEIIVTNNVLKVKEIRSNDGSVSIGSIEMSNELPNYGKGYYHHEDIPNAFGFREIQITF